ncbi:outer membrane beta-barrel protein [Frigidibacter albus]|uniref:Outer membrane beta-barrel protein n=1 Tax=Frigidibacter albus TaxID=1465486 RepID=A0A6L8VJI5_9RHOB|nr:outer membrane beta-barrel protein [Frigidibacter albus]MZQ90244.1 outer membrane beta-barrel protein [Frigidibacter albus]NBE32258.1 outer membrane beta-barrel protein [Frigidibacter albus]GGH58325.1 membrane protein [Frigidibacter albus]
MTLSKYSLPLLAAMGTTLALPALAGGLTEPVYEPAPVVVPAPVAAPSNWAGGYAGVVLGYAEDDVDITDDLGVSPDDQPKPKGGLAGLTGGYNFQSGNWVYGVEADIAKTDLSDKGTFDLTAEEYDVEINSMATLRGRVGYDMGRWMPYATAGFAAADADYSFDTGADTISDGNTMTGYSAGVGAEYAISDNWSAKGEYLYTNLEGRFQAGGGVESADVDHEIHAVRAGLNYRF